MDGDTKNEEEDRYAGIFTDDDVKLTLQKEMSKLSPRRTMQQQSELFATTTLQFYQNISPSVALDHLFDWFHSGAEAKATQQQQSEDDGSAVVERKISLDDFNRLRKCLGKPVVAERDWTRALEHISESVAAEKLVTRQHFKALFGPPPFFGSAKVERVVHDVMAAEESIYFAKMLAARFGVDTTAGSSSSSLELEDAKRMYEMGLEHVQELQRASCADTVFTQDDWTDLCAKVNPTDLSPTQRLTWMQFVEAFYTAVKGKRMCAPHKDTAAVVYAMFANDRVLETIKDQDDDQVSQKAFTNLLRVKKSEHGHDVSDKVWLELLQDMQQTYTYRKEKRGRKTSITGASAADDATSGHGHDQPLVIVRNTRNQVLSYEIVFDEHGDIGLGLRSDFFGQCVTVTSKTGQAGRHAIIQEHDIIAAVNDDSLIQDTMVQTVEEEEARVAAAKRLLNANSIRTVTFLRQESYFQYFGATKTVYLYLKTLEQVPPDGRFRITVPFGSSWKPTTFSDEDGTSSLAVEFESPKHDDFAQAIVSWSSDVESIEIELDGEVAISAQSTVVIKVTGIDCGADDSLGPCEVAAEMIDVAAEQAVQSVPACLVTLFSSWDNRKGKLEPMIRNRVRHTGDGYFDASLKPHLKEFPPGPSGLTLQSDFFGQCAVVTNVETQAANKDVLPHDILSSIISVKEHGGKTLSQINCIKPFSLSKVSAAAHIESVKHELDKCHTSGRPYDLEFLRLNSYFFHENGRTIFTFHALTTLREGTSLVLKMPSAKWDAAADSLAATIVDPSSAKIREVFWDSQQHAVHLTLDASTTIPETRTVVIEILGVAPPSIATKSKAKAWNFLSGSDKATGCAGPSEVVGFFAGDINHPPELEFVLHEHWHSFIVGHRGIDASKVNETLKKFQQSPASLWKVLEFTCRLFDKCKARDSETMSLGDLNKLLSLACGESKMIDNAAWTKLCRTLGANAFSGLSRRQFACCWSDVTGLSSDEAKHVYVRIETAEKLFHEIIATFQEDDEQDVITKETIRKLAVIGGFSEEKALELVADEQLSGWDCDLFCQIVCGGNSNFQFDDNASSLWIKIFYAKKLFREFSDYKVKHKKRVAGDNVEQSLVGVRMRKQNFADLLAALKETKLKLSEQWGKICDIAGLDETSGFTFGDFLKVYSCMPLGPRHPLADYYRIETFRMLPDVSSIKANDVSKEAVLDVAPERVDVKSIAAKAFEGTVSTDDVFQELLKEKIEFSKLEEIEEREDKDFKFTTKLKAKQRSRNKGFLHLRVRSVSELLDNAMDTGSEFNRNKKPEELYMTFEVTNAKGVRSRMPSKKKRHGLKKMRAMLFGSKRGGNKYKVQPDELWDDGKSQALMNDLYEAEKELAGLTQHTKAYNDAVNNIKTLMEQLKPPADADADAIGETSYSDRVFSSRVLRDPSPDAIVTFPDDEFRLFVDMSTGTMRKLLVCKLFKSIGSEKRRLEIELRRARDAHTKAKMTHTILKDLVDQQEHWLTHHVASHHREGTDAADDNRVWFELSKLRQKRQDLIEFKTEVKQRKNALDEAQAKFDATPEVDATQQPKENQTRDAADTDTAARGVTTPLLPVSKNSTDEPSVELIGLAIFDLKELLDVLHDDKEVTDDMRSFRTEDDKDIAKLYLECAYKCELLQSESPREDLPPIEIAMSGNDDTSVIETIAVETAQEYPSHSHLEIEWAANDLRENDRLCLVREGDKHKLSMVYFVMLWRKPRGVDDGECDWRVPDALRDQYSVPNETITVTNASRQEGVVQFPCSLSLSLPPGSYRVYLLRNSTIDELDGSKTNLRLQLGKTDPLAVLPGCNSVHTSFGTTPLIDVKTVFASLQVFAANDRSTGASEHTTDNGGNVDEIYAAEVVNKQELEVTKHDVAECKEQVKNLGTRKDGEAARERLQQLTQVLATLEAQHKQLRDAKAKRGVQPKEPRANVSSLTAQLTFACNQEVVIAYRFHVGEPTKQDHILILPAEVVRVADNLRSSVLGKLQGNNPMQVESIRQTMEVQLAEVGLLITLKFSLRGFIRLVYKYMYKRYCRRKTKRDDGDRTTLEADDATFVWDECMRAYNAAPPIAKKNFGFILRDLLDEIGARKDQLGLAEDSSAPPPRKIPTLKAAMKTGIEVPVLPSALLEKLARLPFAKYRSCPRFTAEQLEQSPANGECRVGLANHFREGGYFVAKYVRRAGGVHDKKNSKSAMASAGEICRFGPFYVQPASISCAPTQMYKFVVKQVWKAVKSDWGKLTGKCLGNVCISGFKYFLGIVSLSFNISVLVGTFDPTQLNVIVDAFRDRLKRYYGPVQWLLAKIDYFFMTFVEPLLDKLKFPEIVDECVTGFYLFPVLALLFSATFVVYVVVQEDLLLKIQKINNYLPFNPGKAWLDILEQIGALLVIPLYLMIKSCVLFISGQWAYFYDQLQSSDGLAAFKLHNKSHGVCTNVHLAKLNYGFGIAALVLIVAFLFVCLPLLLLDLYSWVPLSELEKPDKLKEVAHSFQRMDIKTAVHSNASLVECRWRCRCSDECKRHPVACKFATWWQKCSCCQLPACCKLPGRWSICKGIQYVCQFIRKCFAFRGFHVYYSDYTSMKFRPLLKKYGILGLLSMFTYVYINLMLQSMARSLGVLVGWRSRAPHMYKNPAAMPVSTYKCYDRFCIRFNAAWKVQYIKDKMVMPLVNVVLVTFGLWGEDQWREFNVEERANNCYVMEPSSEIKQLQMMSLHGKIVSLFWLCIPKTMVLAYLAEVLNRGPVFGYFLNKKFLQADIPESEREVDPVWRFAAACKFPGEEDVVYLTDTRFYSTMFKWTSSVVEIITLLMVYTAAQKTRSLLFTIALMSAAVTPLLELNQQVIKAYVDYKEAIESFTSSSDMFAKAVEAKKAADNTHEAASKCPKITLRLPLCCKLNDGNTPTGVPSTPVPAATSTASAVATASNVPANGDRAASANPTSADAAHVAIEIRPDDVAQSTPDGVAATSSASDTTVSSKSASVANRVKAAAAAAVPETITLGGDDNKGRDDNSIEKETVDEVADEVADEIKDVLGDDAAAVLFAGAEAIKPKKELILMKALPEMNYVVVSDALDAGEGEITVSWQVNAKQRFHALDAIGMFPAREPGDMRIQTMEDCICYRLLKHSIAQEFGWKPESRSAEDFERDVLARQAKSLRHIAEDEIKVLTPSLYSPEGEHLEHEEIKHKENLRAATKKMDAMRELPQLKPYTKKMSDMLEDEVLEKKPEMSRKAADMRGNKGDGVEEFAKKARKVISGQVQFRPANSYANASDPKFDMFVYGNNVGIYQSKYGLQNYEFLYLRHADIDVAVVGLSQTKAKASGEKTIVAPIAEQVKHYEVLERFCSNQVSVGTFHIFMTLTSDVPLVGANDAVNLSWTIYGVPYRILSDPKCRNCIGFYKVEGCGGCTKIEIIPTSAYSIVDDNSPCPGRMLAVAPKEPGIYEIRFLFNFFKEALLHRQCQVFGDLEDQMQQLRIRAFYEKRTLADEVQKFAMREPKLWGVARTNTYAWLKSMLISTVRERASNTIMESTSAFSSFLYGRLHSKLSKGLENKSTVYQARIREMVAPLYHRGFMNVLQVALTSSSQMNDQLAAIVLLSPTEEDEKNRNENPDRNSLLLPSDKMLLQYGPSGFRLLARNYLNKKSLCGYHDFVDDIVLNHVQMLNAVNQVMNNLASSCVMLYEVSIQKAASDMAKVVKELRLDNAMQGIDATLIDLCRNHIQSIIRAFVATDCRTGRRWPGATKASTERILALRRGSLVPATSDDNAAEERSTTPALPGGAAPVTRQYVAVRRWIRPRLERKIITILRQRHARLLAGNYPIVVQVLRNVAVCYGVDTTLTGSPFPTYKPSGDKSALYFLEESRTSSDPSSAAETATAISDIQPDNDEIPDDEPIDEDKTKEGEAPKEEEPKDEDEDAQQDVDSGDDSKQDVDDDCSQDVDDEQDDDFGSDD